MNKKIIILILSLIIIAGSVYTYLTVFKKDKKEETTSKTSTEIIDETESNTGMEDNVNWDKYKTYDITLQDSLKITTGGVYNITGTLNGTITVNTEENVKLVLNNVTITSTNAPAINIENAKNTYIELVGENKINSTTTDDLDGAIYSSDDLLIEGEGSINITSNKDGIVSKDDLTIKSGNITITSTDDGIRGKDSVTINGGNIVIDSQSNGIKTTNEEKGIITITDGKIKINSIGDAIQSINTITITGATFDITTTSSDVSSKGIKATNNIVIKNGTININKSYEGIEGSYITINNGDIKVISSDDGINVSGGNDNESDMFAVSDGILTINGGKLYVNSSGDGLDSNGSIKITGGTTYVDGPTNNGNGALDYNGSMEITGGTIIAVGSSGMAQNASNSNQASLLINLTTSYSSSFTIGYITYTPKKSYNSIMISSDKLKVGETYNLVIDGTNIESITLNDTITSIGNTSMGGGMGPQGNKGGMRR